MATPQSTPTKSSELSKKTLLKKYGRDDLPDVAEINLKKKKFTKINPNTFRSLRHLEEIRLDENQVDEIEVTTFADLTSLEHLYLTHNKLKRIDSPILKGLTQLECVAFDENQIDYIIPHLFKGLSNIKEIYLNSNKLTRIEAKTFRGLNILENLRLESNEISLIDPTSFEGLSNLKYLYIFRNKLTSIDSETFKGLNELEKLYMGDNPIVELDNKIFKDLTNLAELFLNDMKLTKIDPSLFRSLTKLKALDLNTNQIEEIDSKTFESFTNLKYLFLNGNKLRQIEPNTFKPLDKLLQLTIYDNQIEEIDSTIFETLVNLKELDLSCNKIKRIGSNLFSRLIKLEKLYLIDNQIEEIDENSFVSLINLHELKLENNKLTRFIRKWFENLPSKSVKLVDLRKNPADVVSYFETKFCARSKFDHTSGEVRFTSCWDDFIKQFPEPICEQVVETLPASDLASESISMDILPDISIVDEILQPTPLSDDLPIDDSNTRDQNRDKPAATESMVESTYSTAYSPSSSSSRSQQQNVERVINRESLRPDINVFGNGDMTSISSIGMRPNNGERFSMNRGVRESLTFAQNTSNLSRLPNKMEIARQRESLRPDHSASTNSLSNQLIGEQIRGRFRVKRFLGEGAFGEVYRALNENGIERALKLIKKDEEWNERNEESLQRIKEIDLLQQVQHENLLRYFEHFDEVVFGVDCLCLVSELCENGDLKSQINYAQNTGKRISDLKIVRWMVEATTGLKHLHDEKIIHRNIKPSNLLLTKNNVIKLADFGVTKYIDSSLIFNLASCRAYMCPEISHFMQFTKKADIWSLGCVLFELANLKVAFPLGARFDDDQPVSIPELGSSRFTWILKSMLELNKEKRIDANDLFETLCFERSTIEEEEM